MNLRRLLLGDANSIIFTIDTFAESRAADPRVETLAIVFQTACFRTGTAPGVQLRPFLADPLELIPKRKRIFFLGQPPGRLAKLGMALRVQAALAPASRAAQPAPRKALTVKPQALARLAAAGVAVRLDAARLTPRRARPGE